MTTILTFPDSPAQLPVKRRPGRPRKVTLAPTVDERDYLDRVAIARHEAILADPIVSLPHDAPVGAVLDAVVVEVAREVASIGFESMTATPEDQDAAQRSSRRVRGLLQLADLLLVREQLRFAAGEISAEQASQALALFACEVRAVAQETIPPELAQLFLARLDEALGS